MANEPDQPAEVRDSAPSSEKTKDTEANKEASAGKEELVNKQKEERERIKAGGHTGVTDAFGKPILFESAYNAGKKAVTELAKVFKGEEPAGSLPEKPGESTGKPVENPSGKPPDSLPPQQVEAYTKPAETTAKGRSGNEAGEDAEGKGRKQKPDKPGEVNMEPMVVTAKPPYTGEGVIKRDLPADRTYGREGDTPEKIAKNYLPPDATPEEIKAYTTEICKVNGLDPKHPGDLKGKELVMPGHTKDGGISTLDENYVQTTKWPDGAEKIEEPGGRGYARKPDGTGGYTENHWGPRPGDNFELTHSSDGKLLIADKPGDTPREVPPASPEVAEERQKLKDLAEEKIKDPEKRAKFEADMLRFEERAAKQTPPLSPEEIAKTYKEMERLLNATGDAPLKQDDRIKLAEQVMSQVANPKSIDQGQHETCNMTTAETIIYTKSPSEAVKLVTDVATTGEYTAKDGTKVKVDPTAADGEAKGNPPNDGDRSHASQIFQVTAVNLYYQKQPYTWTDSAGMVHTVPAGQLEYQQQPAQPGAVPPVAGGERLLDHTTNPPTVVTKSDGTIQDSPDLADRAMVDVPNMITGKNDAIMIEHEKAKYGDTTGVNTFKNEQEMKDFIKKAKEEGKMPIIIGVHTGQEPFLHDSGNGAAGGSGGWHVVTITDYDDATGKVKIDNQWGSSADHQGDNGVSIDDLYRASRNPADTEMREAPWYKPWEDDKKVNVTIESLQKDVDYNREHGTIDTQKELELLRLKNKHGGMSDADYDKELKKTIDESAERWKQQKADGTFDQNEYNNAQAKLRDMVKALPPDRRIDFIDQMHKTGMIDDKMYATALQRSTEALFADTHTDAQAAAYMTKLKAQTDAMSETDRNAFYQSLHDGAFADTRLDMAKAEKAAGIIDDAKYDDLIVGCVQEWQGTTHTAAETAAFTARLTAITSTMTAERVQKICDKISPPAPAPVP